MIFYLGIHMIAKAGEVEKSFISVNRLWDRVSNFKVNTWIMDSGAFTEVTKYGHYRFPVSEYAARINRFASCGNLEMAVSQDYMCEPFALKATGLSIPEHQRLTIQRYDVLKTLSNVYVLPVLQGFKPEEYVTHLRMYGDRLADGMRVGVGSVCKRNKDPKQIIAVLDAIKTEKPGLRLHGFGLKFTALADAYINSMLYSADSMAWSFHERINGGNANGIKEALAFASRINQEKGRKGSQLILCK